MVASAYGHQAVIKLLVDTGIVEIHHTYTLLQCHVLYFPVQDIVILVCIIKLVDFSSYGTSALFHKELQLISKLSETSIANEIRSINQDVLMKP